jgi:hypothetical protein
VLAEDLHCALIDTMGFGENGCSFMALEQIVFHAQVGEEYREVQATAATADDDDRDQYWGSHLCSSKAKAHPGDV